MTERIAGSGYKLIHCTSINSFGAAFNLELTEGGEKFGIWLDHGPHDKDVKLFESAVYSDVLDVYNKLLAIYGEVFND